MMWFIIYGLGFCFYIMAIAGMAPSWNLKKTCRCLFLSPFWLIVMFYCLIKGAIYGD